MEARYFSKHIIMIAILGFVSGQGNPNPYLGIFNIRFKIVLTNQAQGETSTAAATTPSSITEATTGLSPTTAQATTAAVTQPVTNANISTQLHFKLAQVFSTTTGYMSTTTPTEISKTSGGSILTYEYDVIFNKTLLNNLVQLHMNSLFIDELRNCSKVIVAWNTNFTDGYVVHRSATENEMSNAITTVNLNFANDAWLCNGAACSPGTFCNVTGGLTNTIVCQVITTPAPIDKCVEFEKTNNCTDDPSVAGVYLRGECKLDDQGNAYCDCGMSSGDIMNNFFDGHQCVSVTFIVAMAASAGGFLLLLLLLALCALCNRKGSKHDASRRSSLDHAYTNYNGYSESHAGVHEMNQSGHDKVHGSPKDHRKSSLGIGAHAAYHVTRQSNAGVEMHQTGHNKAHGSPKDHRRSSLGIGNHAYHVTRQDTVEFKSIRL